MDVDEKITILEMITHLREQRQEYKKLQDLTQQRKQEYQDLQQKCMDMADEVQKLFYEIDNLITGDK